MRLDLPDAKTLVHEMTIPLRWGDMDAMRHINNTLYFRYFEIVRLAWFDTMGWGLNPSGIGPVIVNAFCNFHIQLEHPGELLARHYVGAVGNSSFETYVTLERTDRPGVIHASGGAKIVWIDSERKKSVPLPQAVRQRLPA